MRGIVFYWTETAHIYGALTHARAAMRSRTGGGEEAHGFMLGTGSLVPIPRAPPGEKRSGERSRISWAYSPKR